MFLRLLPLLYASAVVGRTLTKRDLVSRDFTDESAGSSEKKKNKHIHKVLIFAINVSFVQSLLKTSVYEQDDTSSKLILLLKKTKKTTHCLYLEIDKKL